MTSEEKSEIIKRANIRVAHSIPGRTRLKLDRAYRNPQLMQTIAEILFQSLSEVTDFRINPLTGSIVLTHRSSRILELEIPQLVQVTPLNSMAPATTVKALQPPAHTSNVLRLAWTGVTFFVELPLAVVLALAALEIIGSLVRKRRLAPAQILWLALDLLPFVKIPQLPSPRFKNLKCLLG